MLCLPAQYARRISADPVLIALLGAMNLRVQGAGKAM